MFHRHWYSAANRLQATLIAVGFLASTNIASACCLTDWLYGRAPAYAAAPVAASYAVGYSPAVPLAPTTPVTAGYTPVITNGIALNRPALPLAGSSIYAPQSPYSLQRPAYGSGVITAARPLDNPSVYTGLPVASGYRGLATTSNPYYGTGNIYPSAGPVPNASIAAAPVTSLRPVVGAQAIVPAQPTFATPIRTGLSRFFSSLLGTGYRTSYYNAPITYYRPATTLNPITGTTVTTQQPCTSTVTQVQRTPFAALSPTATSMPVPTSSMGCGVSPIGTTMPFGQTIAPTGGVMSGVPMMGVSSNGDLQPISPPALSSSSIAPSSSFFPPSTAAPLTNSSINSSPAVPSSRSLYPEPNLTPLTGSSEITSPSDRQPMAAPSIESARPSTSYRRDDQYEPFEESQRNDSLERSFDDPINDIDLLDPVDGDQVQTSRRLNDTRVWRPSAGYHDVRPIPASPDYQNPFDRVRASEPLPTQARRDDRRLSAPDLLPALPDSYRGSNEIDRASRVRRQRLSVPVREASIRGIADRIPQQSQDPSLRNRSPWQSLSAPTPVRSVTKPTKPGTPTETGWYSKR
ncbi:MAG: hypothetical protein AAF539_07225 [Planctomycetota bacterium]